VHTRQLGRGKKYGEMRVVVKRYFALFFKPLNPKAKPRIG
jgi:hypothetical protein